MTQLYPKVSFQGLSGEQAGAQGANGSEDTREAPCATNSLVLVHMHESWGQRASGQNLNLATS